MRNFAVAAWERRRNRERELRVIEAETAEHAIVAVAAARPPARQAGIYEAWPVEEPAAMVRFTFEERRGQL